jgi:hypothetical protein
MSQQRNIPFWQPFRPNLDKSSSRKQTVFVFVAAGIAKMALSEKF